MAQLAHIKLAQENLEETFSKRMAELEAQLVPGGPKDTVAKVAEEFRTFRELMFTMLGLLRQQVNECCAAVDSIETHNRRKALIFLGVPELEKEDCAAIVKDTVCNKLLLKDFTVANIRSCHRLGASGKDHHRPILVRFSGDIKAAVWRNKSRLKGSSIAVKEFLTKTRQDIFNKARQHFGMRGCWTQDGLIILRTSDGSRHKVTTADQLQALTLRYPKPFGTSTHVAGRTESGTATTSVAASKQRK